MTSRLRLRLLWPALLTGALVGCRPGPEPVAAGRQPELRPELAGATIPPNIAPLNFRVLEPATRIEAELRGAGTALLARGADGVIRWPAKPWRRLLQAATGSMLELTVRVRPADGRWVTYEPLRLTVAREPIDEYLVYRRIRPLYNWFTDVRIHQRRLTDFSERLVFEGRQLGTGCVNCHSFPAGRTDWLTIGVRSEAVGSGTLLAEGRRAEWLPEKFGYTAWHPSGRLVAYSVNDVGQFFHAARPEVRDVLDTASGLAVYRLDTRTVVRPPQLDRPERLETYPTWSPDGRTLYFCRAARPWGETKQYPPPGFDRVKYELWRVAYALETDRWGEPEPVLTAAETGRSLTLPRLSPDGRWLVFCLSDYGCFPIFQPSSDLYLLDLSTGRWRELEVNSERSEAWHSFSSNGRWLAFSSKRRDGLFTRTMLTYFDPTGRAHPPFVVPREDPDLDFETLQTYSLPELASEPVRVSPFALGRAARAPRPASGEATGMAPRPPG